MRKFLINLWKDEDGASAAEYALLLAVVAVVIAAGAALLGGAVAEAITEACNAVNTGLVTPTGC